MTTSWGGDSMGAAAKVAPSEGKTDERLETSSHRGRVFGAGSRGPPIPRTHPARIPWRCPGRLCLARRLEDPGLSGQRRRGVRPGPVPGRLDRQSAHEAICKARVQESEGDRGLLSKDLLQ
ncbi:hypothetical protein H8959_020992 [Pygathrix nigripes]